MNSPINRFIFPSAIFLVCSFASSTETNVVQSEAKLIGAWQEGMTTQLQQAGVEQLKQAQKIGILRGVVQYSEDHTFTMYPPCGVKADDLRKVGMQSIKGTWELSGGDQLIVKVEANGKSMKIETKLTWDEDQLILVNKDGTVGNKSGRFLGKLPLSC